MLSTRTKSLGLRLGRQRRLAGALLASFASVAPTTVVVAAATTVAVTAFATSATAAASTTTITVATAPAPLGDELGRDPALVAARTEHLEALRLLASPLGRQDRRDFDPVDEEFGLDPQFASDGGPVGHQRRGDDALGLTRADRAPGPGLLVSDRGQLDIDPA